jgi:hypothetical protein
VLYFGFRDLDDDGFFSEFELGVTRSFGFVDILELDVGVTDLGL